jgi:hypothetical protein
MQFVPIDTAAASPAAAFLYADHAVQFPRGAGTEASFECDVFSRVIGELSYGETRYPLRRPLRGRYSPGYDGHPGTFRVIDVPAIAGDGDDPFSAYEDWRLAFHRHFLSFFFKRPFEMTPEAELTWRQISEVVDLQQFRAEIPVIARRFGIILSSDKRGIGIQWDDGHKILIWPRVVPPVAWTYQPGDEIEAIVSYDPESMRVTDFRYISQREKPPQLLSDEEAQAKIVRTKGKEVEW